MFQRISAADAHTMMDSEEVQIADIRDVVSYDQGHICGATRVDNQNLAQFIAACDVSKPLLVCCYHGNSSQGAAQYFAEQGFTQAYSLDGGYEMWKVLYPQRCQG